MIGRREGRNSEKVTVLLPYGKLLIEQLDDGTVMMTRTCDKDRRRNIQLSREEKNDDNRIHSCTDNAL